MENDEDIDALHVPAEVILFPIDDYLLRLIRAGELEAVKHNRTMSRADWARLEIGEGGDFENVRISREDALKKFPAERPSAEWIALMGSYRRLRRPQRR